MTINDYILPMARIFFLVFPGAQLLDVSGPSAVFSLASRFEESANYQSIVVSEAGGLIEHSSGIFVDSTRLSSIRFGETDSIFVVGGQLDAIEKALESGAITGVLQRSARKVQRVGSICSGTFILGAAGLISGRKVATHWAASDLLQSKFPHSFVDHDSLYINDGNIWSSAGVTSGIDMALAIVESEFGPILRSRIAKQLVVYSHRPGYQSQFSQLLVAQSSATEHFKGLLEWLTENAHTSPKVEDMAAYVGMSTRSFYRRFAQLFGTSPGKFSEQVRLDHAKKLLESGRSSKAVAYDIGFKSEAAFRKAFKLSYGLTPGHYAAMR